MMSVVFKMSWGVVLPLIFMHFVIVNLAGYPLTIVPFAIILFLLVNYTANFSFFGFNIFVLALLWPIFILIYYFFRGGDPEINKFLRTYLLWFFAVGAVCYSVAGKIREFKNYFTESIIVLFILGAYSFLQVVLFYYWGSDYLYFPFRDFSYLGVTDPAHFLFEGSIRANSFYLEPSFNAFVIFFCSSLAIITASGRGVIALLLVGLLLLMFLTGSAVGLLSAVGLCYGFVVSFFKYKGARIAALLVTLPLVYFLIQVLLGSRLDEFGVEGSSGYWRLVAPLAILEQSLQQSIFGTPLGQIAGFVESIGLMHGGAIGSSIDNGAYVLIFYYGLPSIVFLVFLCAMLMISLVEGRLRSITFWWFCFFSLQFSGGILTPEFVFPMVVLIYSYRVTSIHGVMFLSLYPASRRTHPVSSSLQVS